MCKEQSPDGGGRERGAAIGFDVVCLHARVRGCLGRAVGRLVCAFYGRGLWPLGGA